MQRKVDRSRLISSRPPIARLNLLQIVAPYSQSAIVIISLLAFLSFFGAMHGGIILEVSLRELHRWRRHLFRYGRNECLYSPSKKSGLGRENSPVQHRLRHNEIIRTPSLSSVTGDRSLCVGRIHLTTQIITRVSSQVAWAVQRRNTSTNGRRSSQRLTRDIAYSISRAI